MTDPAEHVGDLIFGGWRSQILYAGAALGVFDHVSADRATTATALAQAIGADAALLYRLLRALASIGLLREKEGQAFMLTASGALLRAEDARSLRAMALLEEGPEHYAIWKHLPAMIREGRQNAFVREFGAMAFAHARARQGLLRRLQPGDDQLLRAPVAMGAGGAGQIGRRHQRPNFLGCFEILG